MATKKKTAVRHAPKPKKHEDVPDIEELNEEEEMGDTNVDVDVAGDVSVDVVQDFFSDEYGVWINAGKRYSLRADLAQRWLEEGKAMPVMKGIETPETGAEHETATIKLAETK